jgi:hypothetical protein
MSNFNDVFGFFSYIPDLPEHDLLNHCKTLHLKLTDETKNESDIDGNDLFNEIKALKLFSLTNEFKNPSDLLQYIFENNLSPTFPNLTISLRILLTLPVSVASGERSFSKLKLIKNYLRSTMLQERLSGLAILSIECELLDTINTEDILKEFAAIKSRKVQFFLIFMYVRVCIMHTYVNFFVLKI